MHGCCYFIIYIIVRILFYNYKNNRFLTYYSDKNYSELYDLGFNNIKIIYYNFLDDILVMLPLILCIYYKINFSEFLFMLTMIYLLREITTSVTLLPPTPYCINKSKERNNSSKIITQISGACNETIFSGHTSLMLLAFLFVLPKIKNNYIKIIIYFYAIFTSIVIISLRSHYTIDIILAWIICILFYVSYFGNKIVKKLLIN